MIGYPLLIIIGIRGLAFIELSPFYIVFLKVTQLQSNCTLNQNKGQKVTNGIINAISK